MSKPFQLPSLPSTNKDSTLSALPSLNQTTVPPPADDLHDETSNNGSVDEDDSFEEDDSEDTIKTEENVEEIECPELNNILSLPSGVPMSDAPKKLNENRSLKVLKQIVETQMDERGNSTFENDFANVEKKKIENLKNPQLKKVYMDNAEIFFEGKNVASVMESVDENLSISKPTQHVMVAICKVFLSELVSETQRVRDDDKNGMGPLLPQEVLAAYRRLLEKGSIPDINRNPFFCDH